MSKVVRIGVTISEDVLRDLDILIKDLKVKSRSMIISRALREYINDRKIFAGSGNVIGTINILYNHHEHETAQKLNEIQHKYAHIIRSTTHVHIDKERCFEIIITSGDMDKIREFYLEIEGLRGVKMIKPIFFNVETRPHFH